MEEHDMDVMIDLETLGVRPDAAIIQIGAVLFEPESGGRVLNNVGFNRHVLVQDGSGSIDHATLCFWLTERSAGRMGEALLNNADQLWKVLDDLDGWPREALDMSWEAVSGVWAWPSNFDLAKLQAAYARVGRDVPWHHRVTRDARTLWHLADRPKIDWTGFTPHDAFDDAVGQAMTVQKSMGLLS